MSFYPSHEIQAVNTAPREQSSRLAAGTLVFLAHGLLALLLLLGITRQVTLTSKKPSIAIAELSRDAIRAVSAMPPAVHPLHVAPVTMAAPEITIAADASAPAANTAVTATSASAMTMASGFASSGSGVKAGSTGAAAASGAGNGAANAADGNGGYDLGDYLARVSRHIQRHLVAPTPFSERNWRHEFSGTVLVHLIFRSDGKVQSAEIARSSGIPMFDEAALAAVRRSNPLPVFPPEIKLDRINGIIPVFFSTTSEMKPYCAGPQAQADLAAGKCLSP